jgi:NAD(P)-dependent dehydrogenase (short-subunit alcohol dehydrogenase family)
MNIELKGRTAIVTGSTAGIGRATAEGLARAGASVVFNGRGNARVVEAVRQMRQSFPDSEISGVAADLSTAEGADTFFAQAPDADILVNNVGTAHIRDYNGVEDIAKIPDEDWLGLFQLNVMSGVRGLRAQFASHPTLRNVPSSSWLRSSAHASSAAARYDAG